MADDFAARLAARREHAGNPGDIRLTYETAREVLALIEEARNGPADYGPRLNALMLKVARGLPDHELPIYLGGSFEEEADADE